MKKIALIVSCEHAVNFIPLPYQYLFNSFENLLDSHRGIDFGALEIALHFKEVFCCNLILARTSRLLIDCNRSLSNKCFSEITNKLPQHKKQEIINSYYLPYRQLVTESIEENLIKGRSVIHCSIHSFTPIMNNVVRNADIGFLYDPQRSLEKKLAEEWRHQLKKITSDYKIRMNYPYKGTSDGFTTALRKKYSPSEYLGLEIELNQFLTQNDGLLIPLQNCLSQSLLNLLEIQHTLF